MWFGILGPLVVDDGAAQLRAVPGARQRVLLAALLLHANQVVSAGELADVVWDGAPPAAAAALRTQVMRLRHALSGQVAARIVTRDPGYVMTLGEEELDAALFERWCRQAAVAVQARRWSEAAGLAGRALELWRGDPLLEVPSQVLRDGFVPRLEQFRLQALEDRAESGLHLGQHERMVPQLRELTAAHPLRECFHAQLMTALAAAGRRAEALEAYHDARRVLVEELGIEPGPELRDLHGRILAGQDVQPITEPSADHASATASLAVIAPAPRQLPAAPGHFIGRHVELQLLTGLADQPGAAVGGTMVISAIDGMAGIGKTALQDPCECNLGLLSGLVA